MKNIVFFCLLFGAIIMADCKKDDNNSESEIEVPPAEEFIVDTFPIHIATNKEFYNYGEDIIVQSQNLSDSIAHYFICSPYMKTPPLVDRWEENAWESYWSPICDAGDSYCCEELANGEFLMDTLPIELDRGCYRITYKFIVRPNNQYTNHNSNVFQVN